jgi:alpha-mannosidase
VALLNRGLPGNNVAEGTLLLSLMRSATINAYAFAGGYEPGVSSDLGLELGVQRTFDYALVPHAGDWREARVYRAGLEFNNPLITRTILRHAGPLSKQWGLLDVSQLNVVTSALMPGSDGSVILRVYEANGQRSDGVKIGFRAGLDSAEEVNLVGDSIRKLQVDNNSFALDLVPYQIRTFKVRLKSRNATSARLRR